MSQKSLDYSKEILSKVSFDERLFEKEWKKAILSLKKEEITELEAWCLNQFGYRLQVLNSQYNQKS